MLVARPVSGIMPVVSPDARSMNRPASPEIHPARSGAEVCPLPTRIVLSYLTL
jgi:hypothetical protein